MKTRDSASKLIRQAREDKIVIIFLFIVNEIMKNPNNLI